MMRNNLFLILTLLLLLSNCTSIKDVDQNSGSITVGDNNIVINIPQANQAYDNTEVQNEIIYLNKILNKIDYQIEKNNQEEEEEIPKSSNPTQQRLDSKETIELKQKKKKVEDAIKLWESYLDDADTNEDQASYYKRLADSLRVENERLNIQKTELLTEFLGEKVKDGKVDSLLNELIFENAGDFPSNIEFVRKLDLRSYNRMLTLWERKIDDLARKEKYYDFTFENKTDNDIWIAISYFSLDEQWVTEGWYTLPAKAKNIEFKFYTNNSNFYVYGRLPEKTKEWRGNKWLEVVKNSEFTILEKYLNTEYDTEPVPFFHVKASTFNQKMNIPFI